MRTTINLPDALAHEARRRAAEEGRTFTSLVEQGLRSVLADAERPTVDVPPLPTWGSPDDVARVDLLDREALWAALDADGPK